MAKLSRTVNAANHYKPSGRVVQYAGVYLGYVKDNADAQRMGRLRVWIPEFGSRPDDEQGWITVSYCSPFAGATNINLIDNNPKVEAGSQTSYGFWAVPPDKENQVIVMFINADPSRGVWIGSLYQQFMNHMVPGVPAATNYQHSDKEVPVAEYNKNTKENIRNDITRPEITSHSEGIASQGLVDDPIRGPTDSGARRESPSQVYGLLTPGPVDPDSSEDNPSGRRRMGGHQFYLDDGDGREHVRIRTRNGSQLLIDDSNGLVYAINKAGTSWIQMDADGNFDIFAAKSVSVRSQEDINFRADRDLNIEAGRNINIKARNDYTENETGTVGEEDSGEGGGTIRVESLNNIETIVKNDVSLTVTEGSVSEDIQTGDHTTKVAGNSVAEIAGSADINVGGTLTISASDIGIGTGNFNVETGGNIAASGNVTAGGNVFSSSANLNDLDGHKHGQNNGNDNGGGVDTKAFSSSSGGGASGPTASTATPAELEPLAGVEKTNVLATFGDEFNFVRDTETVLTVVGRFLTYEPCPEHSSNNSTDGEA